MARPLPGTFLHRMTVAEFQNPTAFARAHAEMRQAVQGYANLATVFRAEDLGPGREPAYEVWGDPT